MEPQACSCPYCCGQVDAKEVCCARCGRDLSLIGPLALKLEALSRDVLALQGQIAQLSAAREALPAERTDGAQPPTAPAAAAAAPSPAWGAALGMIAACVGATALSHWLLLFVFDARPVVLRLVTMVLPAAIAYVLAPRIRAGLKLYAAFSWAAGALSVMAMLGITSVIDDVPWLPAAGRDLRETAEYMLAIALSSWTAQAIYLARTRRRFVLDRAPGAQTPAGVPVPGPSRFNRAFRRIRVVVEVAAPFLSGGMAIYSGFKAFAGS